MLQRNLLYTGVTRGKRLVVLVGQTMTTPSAGFCSVEEVRGWWRATR